MKMIEVDFDVYKELTYRRKSEDEDYNDVLRDLLKLPPKPKSPQPNGSSGKPWVSDGVVFPHGTEFRGTRKGNTYYARIDNGQLVVDGKGPARGLSHAIALAHGKGENGWKFWLCKRPGDSAFTVVDHLRSKKSA